MISFKVTRFNSFLAIFIFFLSLSKIVIGETIKIATLAPDRSSWVITLRAIDAELRELTQGKVKLKIYPGGVQGDEDVVLRKMRIGMLHGGSFAAQGFSSIVPDILGIQMPFLFNDYGEVDFVLQEMNDYFFKKYEEKGFIHLGWTDIGFVHILSKNPVRTIDDIRRSKVWRMENEPITETLFDLANVNSIPLSIPDVLMGLETNLVDVAYASPAAAVVLQWFTRVNFFNELPINYTLGAFLVDKRVFDRLGDDHKHIFKDIAIRHMRKLSLQTRKENAESIEALKLQGLQQLHASVQDINTFKEWVKETEKQLVGSIISIQADKLIKKHLENHRKNFE
ncbi:MAG: TRAP transporter substrate-binding protein DctP [Candidatus Latescibacterota bacterium]|nr:TRAP transporter substrate-binding protein DctP [Candidatus Latescibacterota bacterium]